MSRPVKISTQTYRLNEMVIFATDDGGWQMHEPRDWSDPVVSWKAGTIVSHHRTLRDASSAYHNRIRAARMGLVAA